MTVKELKDRLVDVPDDCNVAITIKTPGGYMCPDGAICNIGSASQGFDWHAHDFLLIPTCELQLSDNGYINWTLNK